MGTCLVDPESHLKWLLLTIMGMIWVLKLYYIPVKKKLYVSDTMNNNWIDGWMDGLERKERDSLQNTANLTKHVQHVIGISKNKDKILMALMKWYILVGINVGMTFSHISEYPELRSSPWCKKFIRYKKERVGCKLGGLRRNDSLLCSLGFPSPPSTPPMRMPFLNVDKVAIYTVI